MSSQNRPKMPPFSREEELDPGHSIENKTNEDLPQYLTAFYVLYQSKQRIPEIVKGLSGAGSI